MSPEQVCRVCQLSQPLTSYGEYRGRNGMIRRRTCNSCRRAQEAQRYAENPQIREKMKETARAHHFKTQYGLTIGCVEQMKEQQGNRCAICTEPFTQTPNVDHCHETGTVRGLLCWACNIGLGKFKDSVESLQRAIRYLGGVPSTH